MKKLLLVFVITSFANCELLEGDSMSDSNTDPFIGAWNGWINFADRTATYNFYDDGTYIMVDEPAPVINDLDRGCVPSDILNQQISFQFGVWTNTSEKIGKREQSITIQPETYCGNDGTDVTKPYGNVRPILWDVKFNTDFNMFYPLPLEGQETDNGEPKTYNKL